jgi:iron(III) transport system substrate-binding protein
MKRVIASLFFACPLIVQAEEVYEFPARIAGDNHLRIEASGDIEVVQPLIAEFQSQYPMVSVTYRDSLTNDLYTRLAKACEGSGPMADIVFSSAVDHMVKLANDGCATEQNLAERSMLQGTENFRNQVFGFSFEPAVIVYNKALLPRQDVPRNRDQLISLIRDNPQRFAGRIGTYDIAASGIGYLFGFFDAEQSSAFGRLIEALGRANARLYCCTSDLLKSIETGETLIGYNLLGSYAARRMANGAPIGIILPSDYTLVLSRAALVPARAANPQNGALFLEFLLSQQGQDVAGKSFFFSRDKALPAGVEGPDEEGRRGTFRPIPLSPALILVTDREKRRHFLAQWQQAFEGN